MMLRHAKLLIAILLLPLCLGTGQALVRIIQASGRADTVWIILATGFACWLVIYLLLPRPMWAYVFGHELTHALWTYLFGGKVKRFKATAKGGQVVVTRTNFLIALAPYFFPIYAAGIVLLFAVGDFLWNWKPYAIWFHLLIGGAYGFHLTLTWHILRTEQSDITDQGFLFSAVIIWLGNVGVLLVGIPLLAGHVSIPTALSWCWTETVSAWQRLAAILGGIRS